MARSTIPEADAEAAAKAKAEAEAKAKEAKEAAAAEEGDQRRRIDSQKTTKRHIN